MEKVNIHFALYKYATIQSKKITNPEPLVVKDLMKDSGMILKLMKIIHKSYILNGTLFYNTTDFTCTLDLNINSLLLKNRRTCTQN